MSKVFKKVFKVAAPILGSVAGNALLPGIGGSFLGGALGGAAGGGGAKGAILGGLGGALTTGGLLGRAADIPTGAVQGPAYMGTGLAGALTRGMDPLSSALRTGINAISNTINSAGTERLLGNITGAAGGQGSGLVNAAISGLGGASQTEALNRIAKQQAAANQNALSSVSPFVGAGQAAQSRLGTLLGLGGQNPDEVLESLRSSPGYQFRLQQGQEALDRQLATRGSLFSGRALQESQRMGQGLADQTYTDYVNNLNRQAALGLGGAGMQAGLYQSAGDIQANRIGAQNDVLNQTLADILAPRY